MNRAAKRVGFTLMGMNGTASLAKRLAPAGVIGVDGMTIDEMIRVLEVVREQLGGNALVCARAISRSDLSNRHGSTSSFSFA
jgi:hypothetical protein